MLSNNGKEVLDSVLRLARQQWGESISVLDINTPDAPFDVFSVNVRIYGKFCIIFEYEKGTFGIRTNTTTGDIALSQLSTQKVMKGFDSVLPKSIQYNFLVLDSELTASKDLEGCSL